MIVDTADGKKTKGTHCVSERKVQISLQFRAKMWRRPFCLCPIARPQITTSESVTNGGARGIPKTPPIAPWEGCIRLAGSSFPDEAITAMARPAHLCHEKVTKAFESFQKEVAIRIKRGHEKVTRKPRRLTRLRRLGV